MGPILTRYVHMLIFPQEGNEHLTANNKVHAVCEITQWLHTKAPPVTYTKKLPNTLLLLYLVFMLLLYLAEYFATRAIYKNQLDKLLLYKYTESKANTLGCMNK